MLLFILTVSSFSSFRCVSAEHLHVAAGVPPGGGALGGVLRQGEVPADLHQRHQGLGGGREDLHHRDLLRGVRLRLRRVRRGGGGDRPRQDPGGRGRQLLGQPPWSSLHRSLGGAGQLHDLQCLKITENSTDKMFYNNLFSYNSILIII